MAEWVSGISTVGALLLGLSILKRNHANAEKSEIDQVGWWYASLGTRWGWTMRISSTVPVHVLIEPADADLPPRRAGFVQMEWRDPELETRWMTPEGLIVPRARPPHSHAAWESPWESSTGYWSEPESTTSELK